MQVFDQKKFKKKDQGFLGVINIRVGDVMPDLSPDSDGTSHLSRSYASSFERRKQLLTDVLHQTRCLRETSRSRQITLWSTENSSSTFHVTSARQHAEVRLPAVDRPYLFRVHPALPHSPLPMEDQAHPCRTRMAFLLGGLK